MQTLTSVKHKELVSFVHSLDSYVINVVSFGEIYWTINALSRTNLFVNNKGYGVVIHGVVLGTTRNYTG